MASERMTAIGSCAAAAVAIAALIAGCATPPPAAPAAPAAAAPAEAAPAPAPAAPELSPAQAKAQAQKLALEAVDRLQNGDEVAARQLLGQAQALDASNEIARKMSEQINADAQKELGSQFFRYTVQRDDSLSKLAQQYLGDRFRFYILAKYNDIANPSRLGAGEVIKIPGKPQPAPPPTAAPAKPAAPPAEAAEPAAAPAPAVATPAPVPVPAPMSPVATLLQKGRQLEANGDLPGAYGAFSEAVALAPGNRDAVLQRDAAKAALIRSYDREATQAFQRQNLDLAIAKWDKLLELDPSNQKAKLERERALELKKRLSEKFGKSG